MESAYFFIKKSILTPLFCPSWFFVLGGRNGILIAQPDLTPLQIVLAVARN